MPLSSPCANPQRTAIPARRVWRGLACLLAAWTALACTASARAAGDPALTIRIYNDRMTVKVAGAVQVYAHGRIDAASAPRLAEALDKYHVPPGADVYLSAGGGDLGAGMALGRLFRARGMSTHLGMPTRGRQAKRAPRTSVCSDACAYAYLGGVYRWAPAGGDRFGIALPSTDADGAATAYLTDMGLDPATLATVGVSAGASEAWPSADQMIATGLANNGRHPLVASFRLAAGIPRLDLDRRSRSGEQRITLQCQPTAIAFTAWNQVGAQRARHIEQHAAHSWVAIDERETLPQATGGVRADADALVIQRSYPRAELKDLLGAKTVGAWTGQTVSALRYGFEFSLGGIERVLGAFHAACRAQVARQPGR